MSTGRNREVLFFVAVFVWFVVIMTYLYIYKPTLVSLALNLKKSKVYGSGNTVVGRAFHSLVMRIRNNEPNRQSDVT